MVEIRAGADTEEEPMQATFLRRPCNVIGFSALHFAEEADSTRKKTPNKCRLRSYRAEHAEVVSTDLDIKTSCPARPFVT